MSESLMRKMVDGQAIRQLLVRWGAFIAGIAVLLQMQMYLPPLVNVPAVYLLPFLPVLGLGLVYWLVSGRYLASIAVWLVIAVPLVGFMWTNRLLEAVLLLLSILTMVALGAIVVDGVDWKLAARWYTFGHIVSSIVLILDRFRPIYPKGTDPGRLGSVFDASQARIIEPNQAGTQAAFALLVALSLFNIRPTGNKLHTDNVIAGIGTLFASIVVALTLSRGSQLATVGAVFVAIVLGRIVLSRLAWAFSVPGGAIVGLVSIPLIPAILSRFTETGVSTAGGRTLIWDRALDLITSSPLTALFGAGTAAGPYALGQFDPSLFTLLSWRRDPPSVAGPGPVGELNPHNAVVDWVLNFGLIGLFIASLALMLAFIRARAIDRGHSLAIGQGMIALFVLISMSLVAYRMIGVSIACGGMTLAYLYHRRSFDHEYESSHSTRTYVEKEAEVLPQDGVYTPVVSRWQFIGKEIQSKENSVHSQ